MPTSRFPGDAPGTVTASATLTSGQLVVGDGTTVVKVGDLSGDVSTSGSAVTTLSASLKTGRLIGVQTITATGAGTYTPTSGTTSVVIELQGGGGGGGASQPPAASRTSIGIGGSGGAWGRVRLTAAFSGAGYVVGAKGTGGAAGNNAGNAGANTTFTATGGGTVYTAAGGPGGAAGSTGNLLPFSDAGAVGGVITNLTVGQSGGASGLSSATANQSVGSRGGDSYYGRGGLEVKSITGENKTGNNATGKGAGGGGGLSTASSGGAGAAGGDGTDGQIVIWEYS